MPDSDENTHDARSSHQLKDRPDLLDSAIANEGDCAQA